MPAFPIEFRRMQGADIPAALELWRSCEGIGLAESDHPDELARFLARNPGTSWLSMVDSRLVGAVLAGHDGRRGFLYHLAVHRSMRRHGIGRALVDRALDGLAAAGILKCQIVVFQNNDEARRFWLHAGWTPRDDLKAFAKFSNEARSAPEA